MKKLNLKDVIDNFDLEGLHKHDFVVVISLNDKDIMGDYDDMIDDLEQYENYNLISATLGYENFSLDENENFKFVVRISLRTNDKDVSYDLDYEDYELLERLVRIEYNSRFSLNLGSPKYIDNLFELACKLSYLKCYCCENE